MKEEDEEEGEEEEEEGKNQTLICQYLATGQNRRVLQMAKAIGNYVLTL